MFIYPHVDIFDQFIDILEVDSSIFILEVRAHCQHYVVCCKWFCLKNGKQIKILN